MNKTQSKINHGIAKNNQFIHHVYEGVSELWESLACKNRPPYGLIEFFPLYQNSCSSLSSSKLDRGEELVSQGIRLFITKDTAFVGI